MTAPSAHWGQATRLAPGPPDRSKMKVPDEVATALAVAEVDGNAVRLAVQLDRALYVKIDKALKAAGGRWNTRAQAHLFPADAQPIITALIYGGDVESDSDRQFFPTPPDVARPAAERSSMSISPFTSQASQPDIPAGPVTYKFDQVSIMTIEITTSAGPEAAQEAVDMLQEISLRHHGIQHNDDDTASYEVTCVAPYGRGYLAGIRDADDHEVPCEAEEIPMPALGEDRDEIAGLVSRWIDAVENGSYADENAAATDLAAAVCEAFGIEPADDEEGDGE